MRARNIKPSIFKNEFLATSDPLYAWIFEGLWCLADREGRLEDRPRQIHLEINAGRAFEGTEASLAWLAEHEFILRYQIGNARYIQVLNFKKHQNPHVREPVSAIPAPPSGGPDEHSASTVLAPGKHQTGPALPSFLIPDSPSPFPDSHTSASPPPRVPEWFDEFKAIYPNRAGDQGWREAQRAGNARISAGFTPEQLIAGGKRYRAYCDAKGDTGTQFVKRAAAFLGPENHFLLPWNPPPTKAEVRQNRNISASEQWLAEQEAKDAAH